MQCQTQLKTAWTITSCPVPHDKIWSTLNPGQSTQTTPLPTVSPSPVAAPDVVDARNAAVDAIAASKEAIDQIEIAKEECLSVSDGFDFDVQELYDSTSLSEYCESLDFKVSSLTSKVLSLNVNQVKTTSDSKKIIEQSNVFSEEADKITAQIQDITDELLKTERQFISIIKSQEPFEYVEEDVINSWSLIGERLALLPKNSSSTIKKTQNYKSASSIFLQISKIVATKNELLEALYKVDKPSEMSTIVRKYSTLKINASQISSYRKLATSINKVIPKTVCTKGALVLLPSNLSKCPSGFDETPTE